MSGDHQWEVKTPPGEALTGVEELHGNGDLYSLASTETRTSIRSREQQEPTIAPRANVLSGEKRSVFFFEDCDLIN